MKAQALPDLSGLVSEGTTDKKTIDKARQNATLQVRSQLCLAFQEDRVRCKLAQKTAFKELMLVREASKEHFLRLDNSLRQTCNCTLQSCRAAEDEILGPLTRRGQKRALIVSEPNDAGIRKRRCVIQEEGPDQL